MTLGKKIPVALAVGGVIGVVVDLGGMPALVMGPRNKTWQDDIVFQFEDAVGFI